MTVKLGISRIPKKNRQPNPQTKLSERKTRNFLFSPNRKMSESGGTRIYLLEFVLTFPLKASFELPVTCLLMLVKSGHWSTLGLLTKVSILLVRPIFKMVEH